MRFVEVKREGCIITRLVACHVSKLVVVVPRRRNDRNAEGGGNRGQPSHCPVFALSMRTGDSVIAWYTYGFSFQFQLGVHYSRCLVFFFFSQDDLLQIVCIGIGFVIPTFFGSHGKNEPRGGGIRTHDPRNLGLLVKRLTNSTNVDPEVSIFQAPSYGSS